MTNQIIKKIKEAKNIAIFTHKNADPDALGSVGAFFYAMKSLNKNCKIFLNEQYEENFDFLKLENVVFPAAAEKLLKETKSNKHSFDLFISMDSASAERLGFFSSYFKNHNNTIEIDHHKNRQNFAKTSLVKFYSSNTEILFEVFKQMQIEISPHIATCILTGIVGDTDGFRNGSTTAQSHKYAYETIVLGADITLVNKALFASKTHADFQIIKRIIERAEFDNHIAISYITEKDAKELNKKKFLTSDLVNILSSIENIEISVLLKQEKGKNFRVSLRSSKNYNVGEFCNRFGGGGHNQAAGMALVGSLKQVKDILLRELKKLEKTD